MERVFRRGLAVFRWGAWLWMAVTFAANWNDTYFRHPWLGLALVLAALVFTLAQTALVPLSVRFANRRRFALGELSVGLALLAFDGLVRRRGIIFDTGPTLGTWWPVIGLVNAATYFRWWASIAAGLSFGCARLMAVYFNGLGIDDMSRNQIISVINVGIFAALLAASVTGVIKLLRSSENEVALARAREEVARQLHDGVLQTLAIVERRSNDGDLVQLARDQQRDLRVYLSDQRSGGQTQQLQPGLTAACNRFEATFSRRVRLIVADDLPTLTAASIDALSGAVGEALNNAGKHAQSTMVTIYVEPADDGGVFCSIKDDGVGFDPSTITPRIGTTRSIAGRIADVGGCSEIKSSPGDGTEVLLWVP